MINRLPETLLSGKNILVGVTGSISAYKACEIVRLFVKKGAEVRVVMSTAATKFVSPLTFEALTTNRVLLDSNEDWSSDFNHIGIGKWADTYLIAPASANTINKLGNGIADNILLSTALAFEGQKLLAPAANSNMLKNPITQATMKLMALSGFTFINPTSGVLACGDEGEGKLEEPEEIFYQTARELLKDDYYAYRGVVLTGGGTIERIDDVRFISNFSSGKMADSLVVASYLLGADPFYITTNSTELLPKGVKTIQVESAKEMEKYLEDAIRASKKGVLKKVDLVTSGNQNQLIQKKPYFFSVAAVSDYTPKFPQDGKMKKDMIGDEWNLDLKLNRDLLGNSNKHEIYSIGFKAEFDKKEAQNSAKNMLKSKNLDGVCLNILGDSVNFGSESTKMEVLFKEKNIALEYKDKVSTAFEILKTMKEEHHA